MIDVILKFLLEDDDLDDPGWKDVVPSNDYRDFPSNLRGDALYDERGNLRHRWGDLRGIRQYTGRVPLRLVSIQKLDHGEGGLKMVFQNDWVYVSRWASFSVLANSLRNWRNIQGANLAIDGESAGQISYRNPRLKQLSESADDLDADDIKDVYQTQPEVFSLEQMKAAEPGFFSRENNRFFGTKKIYQYGNFLVIKNTRRSHGHFGEMSTITSYVIYEFMRTKDTPQGLLLHRQSTNSLETAKAMIKAKDFRPWREQLADRYHL